MDIMELGAIGELVGGVAVIGSLIYLSLQIRQSNATDNLSATLGLQSSFNEISRLLWEDCDELLLPGLNEFNGLPEGARLKLAGKFYSVYSHADLVFGQHQKGMIAADAAGPTFNMVFYLHSWPGLKEWWEVGVVVHGRSLTPNRDLFSPEFAHFLDEGNPFSSVDQASLGPAEA